MDPSHQGRDWIWELGEFPRVKRHPLHRKVFLKIVNSDFQPPRNVYCKKNPHRLTKGVFVFSVGLDVTDDPMKHSPVWVIETEVVGCSDHLGLELVCLALGRLVRRAIHNQAQWVQEDQDSEEVLQYCSLYGMIGYDKYVLLGFEIVVNSLAAGRDIQISEDDSF